MSSSSPLVPDHPSPALTMAENPSQMADDDPSPDDFVHQGDGADLFELAEGMSQLRVVPTKISFGRRGGGRSARLSKT